MTIRFTPPPGWNGAHQYGGRIDGFPARHVYADGIKGSHDLSQRRRSILVHPGFGPLPFVEGHDPLGGKTQGVAFLFSYLVVAFDFFGRDFQLSRGERHVVESLA